MYPIKQLILMVVGLNTNIGHLERVGVTVYLRDHLSYNVRRHIIDYGLELICVEIRPLKCRPFIIVAWHRPPRDPISSFNLLENVLSILDRKTRKLVLLEIKIVFFRKELLIMTSIPYIY